jgi:hypothetical protein
MHGLGDNIHQRAVIRALLKREYSIALETSWPCVYHDLPVRFIRKPVALRTQLKNAAREAAKFAPTPPSHHTNNAIQISYNRSSVGSGTILQAMFTAAGIGGDYADADYTLPIPWEWDDALTNKIGQPPVTPKPLMIYRPLVMRPEWRGSGLRNANPDQYAELITMVRDSFFVVSVADLEANREWIVGPQLIPDVSLNHGELSFETMAALFSRAAVVFTSSGFPAILGPAVRVPTISIQGGFEPSSWHADGAKFAPYLGIDPINPCICATSACTKMCAKTLDMPVARQRVAEFLGLSATAESRPVSEIFAPAVYPPPSRRGPAPRTAPQVRVGHPSLLAQRRPPVRA